MHGGRGNSAPKSKKGKENSADSYLQNQLIKINQELKGIVLISFRFIFGNKTLQQLGRKLQELVHAQLISQ
jgi:hypothetical protein